MPTTVWNDVRTCTVEIVRTTDFPKIVECVPYFENWWHSELAWRFNESPSALAYRFAGFDLRALPKIISEKEMQPDLFLDKSAAGVVQAIVWLQLKHLNLHRRIDPRQSTTAAKLKTTLRGSCDAFCEDLARVRNIDLAKTAVQRFLGSQDLQQQTMPRLYRERPLEIFGQAKHFAASFMLAAVPLAWSDEFESCVDRYVSRLAVHSTPLFHKTEKIHKWESGSGEVRAYLSSLVCEFS